jgi:CheY-like chemotaxis protein
MQNWPPSPAPPPDERSSGPAPREELERNVSLSAHEEARPAPGAQPAGGHVALLGEPQPIDVLSVDDDPRKQEVTRSLLSGSGAQIVEARSAEEALRILLVRDVAVILLDVGLPGMSGLEMARLVRGREQTRHTPIIFLTASSDPLLLEAGYALGAIDFLTPPCRSRRSARRWHSSSRRTARTRRCAGTPSSCAPRRTAS